jgi:16S rRNA (cytosine967-C5)-methyltransferase
MNINETSRHALAILDEVERDGAPLDAVMARFFKDHRALNEAERAHLVAVVYGYLRAEPAWNALANLAAEAAGLATRDPLAARLFLFLVAQRLAPERELQSAFRERTGLTPRELGALSEAARAVAASPDAGDDAARFAIRHGWPAWVAGALDGRRDLEPLLDALNEEPPLVLRANALAATAGDVAEALAREQIATRPGRLSPDALVVEQATNVFRTDAFRRGLFEVQDEGSQAVSLLVDPRAGWRVLDACAGAGGKSLHLATLMRGRGEVFAHDPSARRLEAARRRVVRSGLQNVRIVPAGEPLERLRGRLEGACDAVLVDAPCTGLGTVRRNPDIKLRARPGQAAELAAKQLEILAKHAPFVKPGGRLVYATCSILPEENERVVARFLDASPEFEVVAPEAVLASSPRADRLAALREAVARSDVMRLTPHEHGTDGFFAAVLRRRP